MPFVSSRVTLPKHIPIVRTLLREYAAHLNQSLGEEHICLEAYERELAHLPGDYAEPQGTILIAHMGEKAAGCVALKPLNPSRAVEQGEAACEMKRLWVRPEFRGQSIGFTLAEELIRHARGAGYTAMYLDTVPTAMHSANLIYQRLGFEPVERYNTNPVLGSSPEVAVVFFRLALR